MNLIHCCLLMTSKCMIPCIIYKCLLRTLREGRRRRRSEGTSSIDKEMQKQKGIWWEVTDGGRREVEHLGKAGGWRGEELEKMGDGDIKRKKGRRWDRGQTEWKQPTQLSASVINNMRPMCDILTRAPARLRPPICYITHSKIHRLPKQDIVFKQ